MTGVEGGLEKILLKSFSPTLRPISSDIKHGEKSLPLKSGGGKNEQRQENTRSITSDVDRKKYISKNGSGRERILTRFTQTLYLFIPRSFVLCGVLVHWQMLHCLTQVNRGSVGKCHPRIKIIFFGGENLVILAMAQRCG